MGRLGEPYPGDCCVYLCFKATHKQARVFLFFLLSASGHACSPFNSKAYVGFGPLSGEAILLFGRSGDLVNILKQVLKIHLSTNKYTVLKYLSTICWLNS